MADNTPIEWADATVNAINGCSILSPGCIRCYAMKLAGTRLRNHPSREGLTDQTKAGPVWNGTVRLHRPALLQPLRWKRPRAIFWNAHGDTFHDAVPDDWLWEMFEVIRQTPHHKHMVLTKRPARMRKFMEKLTRLPANINSFYGLGSDAKLYQPIRNLWLGVSVEDQARADERIPDLLATQAAGRFLSCEPLLGPIDLTALSLKTCTQKFDALVGMGWGTQSERYGGGRLYHGATKSPYAKLDGIIVGGESGPGARPMHPDWARRLRDQCAAAGVDFHFKQWGEWIRFGEIDAEGHLNFRSRGKQSGLWIDWPSSPESSCRVGKKQAGRNLDGVAHDALPWRHNVQEALHGHA